MRKGYREFILHLMLRPGWQLAAMGSLLLLMIFAGGYGLALSARIQSAVAIEAQLKTLKEKINQQQRLLLHQRPRAEMQATLDLIAPLQPVMMPLPQQLLAPLKAAGGKLLHWLPDRQVPIIEGLQQQGTFKLQMPFTGLVRLLEELMTQTLIPLAIEQLSITRPESGNPELNVTLQLASYNGNMTAGQRKQAQLQFAAPLGRDPFISEQTRLSSCNNKAEGDGMPELRGVLGDARGYTGWLRLAGGGWLRAIKGETLTDGLGYVDEVNQKQVRVSFGQPRCGEKQQTFTLAGS